MRRRALVQAKTPGRSNEPRCTKNRPPSLLTLELKSAHDEKTFTQKGVMPETRRPRAARALCPSLDACYRDGASRPLGGPREQANRERHSECGGRSTEPSAPSRVTSLRVFGFAAHATWLREPPRERCACGHPRESVTPRSRFGIPRDHPPESLAEVRGSAPRRA